MKNLTKHFIKTAYVYEKTSIKNKKLNALVLFSLNKKYIFVKKNYHLFLVKNKIFPFFENVTNNKKIRPLFYSSNIRMFAFLKGISKNCCGTVLAGKWMHGFIKLKKKPVVKKKNQRGIFEKKAITMLIVPTFGLSSPAVNEAKIQKIPSFGCIHFGDKKTIDLTYFVIGPRNNVKFCEKFCLLLSCLIKWKAFVYSCTINEQKFCFIKHKNYLQKLKKHKNLHKDVRYKKKIVLKKRAKKKKMLKKLYKLKKSHWYFFLKLKKYKSDESWCYVVPGKKGKPTLITFSWIKYRFLNRVMSLARRKLRQIKRRKKKKYKKMKWSLAKSKRFFMSKKKNETCRKLFF